MWKFKFDAPKGRRLMKQGFTWVTCFPTVRGSNTETPKWSSKTNKWVIDESWTSTAGEDKQPKSFKAFKRYLRKHPELQISGVDVILVNRYYLRSNNGEYLHDYNIVANWVEA